MVLARLEVFAALGAPLELGAVATLFAGAANVRRCPVVHLEPPKLGEASVTSLGAVQ